MPEIVYVVLKYATLLALYIFIVVVVRSLYIDLLPRERRVKATSAKATRLKKATTPWLKVISEGKTAAKRYNLGAETIAGRDANCQICLEDEFVSQLHARGEQPGALHPGRPGKHQRHFRKRAQDQLPGGPAPRGPYQDRRHSAGVQEVNNAIRGTEPSGQGQGDQRGQLLRRRLALHRSRRHGGTPGG